MIKKSDFIPAFGLGNSHFQTILPTILYKKVIKAVQRERLMMPDGDFVDFDWFINGLQAPIVIILHGLTGSIESNYVQGILQSIRSKGWRPVLMYHRGCSGDQNLTNYSYHAGDTLGIDTLVKELRRREPKTPICAVGYSMGANLLLKWLGETGDSTSLCTAVAVSTPFDLRITSNRLRHGASRFYQWWLIGELHDYALRKFQFRKPPFDFGDITQLKSIWEFDEAITAPLNGFKDVIDFYAQTSCRSFLKNISIPTLAIHALDDPFMTPDVIPKEEELSPFFTLELSKKGGHVGFIEGTLFPFKLESWLEKRIPEYLQSYLSSPMFTSIPLLPATTSLSEERRHVQSRDVF